MNPGRDARPGIALTYLAPMEGITHPTFRAFMAARGGVDVVCTEFVRVTSSPVSERMFEAAVFRTPDAALSVQIMGNDCARMAEAARLAVRGGADVVDVNLGCPMPRIVRKGVGAAMLKDRDLLRRVFDMLRDAVPGLLSAKLRAGFDHTDEVFEIGQLLQSAGVDFITVHPRRRSDFFVGVADWRIIRALARELRVPVVGNGDVWYARDALRMQQETGCDAVMIGRAALRNPWIFRQLDALRTGRVPERPSGADLFALLLEVRELYETRYRTSRRGAIGPMKELVSYVGRAVRDERAFMRAAHRAATLDEILVIAERCLAHRSADDLDLDAEGTERLELSGTTDSDAPVIANAQTRALPSAPHADHPRP